MDIGVQGDETEDLFVLLSTVKVSHAHDSRLLELNIYFASVTPPRRPGCLCRYHSVQLPEGTR